MPTDVSKAFATYAHYLDAAVHIADRTHNSQYYDGSFARGLVTEKRVVRGVLTAVRKTLSQKEIQARAPGNGDAMRLSLQSAWGTELVIALAQDVMPRETLALHCQWAVVQAYYAVHQATRALAYAVGQDKALTSHPSTQNFFRSMWCDSRYGVAPLNVSYGPSGPTNVPTQATKPVSNLATVSHLNAWPVFLMGLRTTHERARSEVISNARANKARDIRKRWRTEEEARLTRGMRPRKEPNFSNHPTLVAAERTRVIASVRATTLIDFLYRLRIGSNYEDATVYYEGPSSDIDAWAFMDRLRIVTALTLAASEALIRSYVGKKRFDPMVQSWIAGKSQKVTRGTLLERAPLLLS